jgi:hypothetical protein
MTTGSKKTLSYYAQTEDNFLAALSRADFLRIFYGVFYN